VSHADDIGRPGVASLPTRMTTYEVRWLNGTVERVTCRWVDTQPGVMHFQQYASDGPTLVLTVSNAEIQSVRPVSDDDAEVTS